MATGKALLKKYIKETHKKEIDKLKSQNKQCKVSIDYDDLNQFLIDQSGKDFWKHKIYEFINQMDEYFDTGNVTLKFINVPERDNLHDLDATYNNEWISTKAMIKNITDVRVDLKTACYLCRECGKRHFLHISNPTQQTRVPPFCDGCGARSKSMNFDKETSIYRNYRLLKLEEPLELRSGGSTREFKAIVLDFLASPFTNLKVGDVVNVTGLFKIEPRKIKGRSDGFEFIIHVHNITPVDDVFEDSRISEEDINEIINLSKQDNVFDLLWRTLAPEVYGHETIKKGLILQLFEGNRPISDVFKSENMDRWTIHILLIGDPGIGKSQLIQAMKKRAPKNITISGTNTSQAGLTVSTVKDELTGTWTMEAGATVLADTGVLCIDEYDKLSPSAQKSLNEPMEQSSVSSAKAGLVQTMSARTSILAGANPKYGKFDRYKLYRDQLEIPESNLSRFDLIFALEDDVDKEKDSKLADALLNKDFILDESETIAIDLFKKYITWIKANCFPVLSRDAKILLREFYVDTRKVASQTSDGKPITARDLKALERLTIARAKCEFRSEATIKDAIEAIDIYKEALKGLGLSLATAGELYGVHSQDELSVISDMENMIRNNIDMEGGMLSSESLRHLEIECGMLCHEKGINREGIFDIAYENVKKTL
ncbi:minichromosome maintenance protein MCM [Methanobrevibacter millerae]|uniref:Replicative DNA helicase Mcm n=1 Tax=Methanobrevibacter millerae TaxID=230361 RepID=A0A0U2SGX1_9EURY|nr:minichromosome maintenance protein MCM [Methanobrevibacter millerae]ALT68229.1 replicative DNA helicase Mcm [Methanobrevibacter millerae]